MRCSLRSVRSSPVAGSVTVSSIVAYSGAVTAERMPMEVLVAVFPVNFAAPKIVVASGSGNTHGGLLYGLRALGSGVRVLGACVRRAARQQAPRIVNRCAEIAELLGAENPRSPAFARLRTNCDVAENAPTSFHSRRGIRRSVPWVTSIVLRKSWRRPSRSVDTTFDRCSGFCSTPNSSNRSQTGSPK